MLSGNWTGQLCGYLVLFRLLPAFLPNPSVFLHHVPCVFFGGMSAKHMKQCWAGCDGLNLLVGLNPAMAWHLPWTSRAVSPLQPYDQHCGLMISLISLARLKLAQIYLNGAIILTVSKDQILYLRYYVWERRGMLMFKVKTIPGWSHCRLLSGGRACVECKNCSFLRTVQALSTYLCNSFFLTLTFYVPCPVLCSWCAASSLTAFVVFLFCYSSIASTFGGSSILSFTIFYYFPWLKISSA